jgi:erythronate-4-phosphate dehydrogenase
MKIIADANIPLINDACAGIGDVELVPGRDITRDMLKSADALFVRSITRTDADLLEGTKVKFVATATIGTDHVDTTYLRQKGIAFASAPGSNARSVAEYVAAAIVKHSGHFEKPFEELTMGIVGVGNVGTQVLSVAHALGITCILNDPPRERATVGGDFKDLDYLLQHSDIVTIHVPLEFDGVDATFQLADASFFDKMRSNAMFINASRGAVVDESSLRKYRTKLGPVVLDVWENEPFVDVNTLAVVDTATPHIAGYSYDGKLNGTQMVYEALCRFLDKTPDFSARKSIEAEVREIDVGIANDEVEAAVSSAYSITEDDRELRSITSIDEESRKGHFDLLRKKYRRRLEFRHFRVHGARHQQRTLRRLGFSVT